jgi:hypothetical protein
VTLLQMQEERKGAGGGRAIGGGASARRTNGEDGVARNRRMDKARPRGWALIRVIFFYFVFFKKTIFINKTYSISWWCPLGT